MTGPGIYQCGDIEYDKIDAVRFSELKHLASSPLYYQYKLEEPTKPTAAMERGTAVHLAVLEPKRFEAEYAVYRGGDRRGTKWELFKEAHGDQRILKEDEYEIVLAMRDAVLRDPLVSRYLANGDPEVALVWIDRKSGLLCKGRMDFLSIAVADVSLDLKTTATVRPFLFASSYAKLLYHLQAAFYGDGYETLTGRVLYHKCVSIESAAPHDVVVYDVIGDVLETGRAAYRELLDQLIHCRETNSWPGYGRGKELAMRLPAWATRDENDLSDIGLELE